MASCGTKNVKFQLRRDTTYGWSLKNPILLAGEPGYDSDKNCIKIGDGIHRWSELNYICSSSSTSTADDWYKHYLVDPPDAPLNLRVEGDWLNYINVAWDYPQQINVGFQQNWLPQLTNVTAQLRNINLGGIPNSQLTVVDHNNTNKFILDRANTGATGPITLIQLLPRTYSGLTNYTTGPVSITSNGKTHNALQYYNTNLATATGPMAPTGPQMVDLWYENYNTSTGPNKATCGLGGFQIIPGPPGKPRNLYSNLSYPTILSWTSPQYVNINNLNDLLASITSYTYNVSYTGGSEFRYPESASQQTNNIPYTTVPTTQIETNQLYADHSYVLNVKATNTYNLSGDTEQYFFKMALPSAPTDSFIPNGFTRYPGTILFFYNGTYNGEIPSNTLLRYNTVNIGISGTAYVQDPLFPGRGGPSHSYSLLNPERLFTLNFSREDGIAGFTTNGIPIYGFGKTNTTTSQTLLTSTNQVGTLQFTNQASDYYTEVQRQGFYQTIPLSITIPKSNLFNLLPPSYKFYNCRVGSQNLTSSNRFYISGLRDSIPEIIQASLSETGASQQYVSGLLVQPKNVTFKHRITVDNLGDYFFPSGNIATFTLKKDAVDYINAGANMTEFINESQLKWHITKNILFSDEFYVGNIGYLVYVNNINGGTSYEDESSIYKLIDQPSIDLKNLISTSKTIGRYYNVGQYVSGINTSPIPYDHTQSILTTNAIQICNGKFRTKTNSVNVGYLNYQNQLNYTSVSGYKSAMFAWSIDNSNNLNYGETLYIRFNDVEGTVNRSLINEILTLNNNGALNVRYKFVGDATVTTDWIDANSRTGRQANSSNYQMSGLFGIRHSSLIPLQLEVIVPHTPIVSNQTYLLVDISVPMSSNFAFSSVSCSLT